MGVMAIQRLAQRCFDLCAVMDHEEAPAAVRAGGEDALDDDLTPSPGVPDEGTHLLGIGVDSLPVGHRGNPRKILLWWDSLPRTGTARQDASWQSGSCKVITDPILVSKILIAAIREAYDEGRIADGDHTAESVLGFSAAEVEGVHTHKAGVGDGVWFRLRDGRVVDVTGEAVDADPGLYDGTAN
jgi:hypothetical protein